MFTQKILKLGGLSKIISKKKKPEQLIEGQDNLQTHLPSNFSDEVFNLELEAEQQNVEMDVINRLLELYAMAIEYYGNIQSEKCQIFKNKTRSLLMKSNVNAAMDKAQEILKSESNEEADILCIDPIKPKQGTTQIDDQIMKQRQKQLEQNLKYIQQQDTQDSVRTLINSHSQDVLNNTKLIQKQKDIQTDIILQRLQKRKNKINGFDSDDSEQKKHSAQNCYHRKQSNSVDYQNDLAIDIVELSSENPSHSLSRFAAFKQPSVQNNDTIQFSNDKYQQQQYLQDICQIDEDNSKFTQQSFFEQLPPPPPPSIPEQFSINNKETVSMFQEEIGNIAIKPKKKKVRVSKKSALEFLEQHSAIQF